MCIRDRYRECLDKTVGKCTISRHNIPNIRFEQCIDRRTDQTVPHIMKRTFIPVSYTHLDVYKRQNQIRSKRVQFFIAEHRIFPVPVSYTHLDVYKRQHCFHAALFSLLSASGWRESAVSFALFILCKPICTRTTVTTTKYR